jgi:ubiquinone/menaquinone biosynthesis C-methylase UbiE
VTGRDADYVPALAYHWLTPLYDRVVAATTREREVKRALIVQAAIRSEHVVLDLASGTGTLALWIKQSVPGVSVVGVDADPAMIAIAATKAQRVGLVIPFEEGLAYDLPYPAGQFDRVVSSLFFHHLSLADKVRTVHEVWRVLKPGGELHVADWGPATNPLMRGLFVFVQLLDGFTNTRDHAAGRLGTIFEAGGFEQVAMRQRFSTPLGTLALYSAVKRE